MEDKENGDKRPPRRPTNGQGQPFRSTSRSSSNNRGRSSTRRNTIGSHSGSGSFDGRTLDTVSTHSSNSAPRQPSSSNTPQRRTRQGQGQGPEDNLGFDTITCTPQVSRHRSKSRTSSRSASRSASVSGSASKSNNPSAPKKTIRTHSKAHVIKKHVDGQHGQHQSHSNTGSGSVNGRSSSRGRSLGSGYRSDTSAGTTFSKNSSYSRGGSTTRTPGRTNPNRRSRSISQTRSHCSSIGQFEVEPNVHHNAIMSTEIQCPVIAEMKENELYAKRAGINL